MNRRLQGVLIAGVNYRIGLYLSLRRNGRPQMVLH